MAHIVYNQQSCPGCPGIGKEGCALSGVYTKIRAAKETNPDSLVGFLNIVRCVVGLHIHGVNIINKCAENVEVGESLPLNTRNVWIDCPTPQYTTENEEVGFTGVAYVGRNKIKAEVTEV